MKYTTGFLGLSAFLAASLLFNPLSAEAGWGHLRGGSSGVYAGLGSSGAYYGSSGYRAGYASSGGSSGYSVASVSYASSGGSSGYSVGYASYGSSGRPGILGRLRDHLAAKHARHAARRAARYASSGGSSGVYYGSSGYSYRTSYYGGSSGSYSGGSSGSYSVGYTGGSSGSVAPVSYGSSGGTSYYGASLGSSAPVSSLVSNVSGDSVYLTVAVPSEAKVFVNGKETTSTGAVRQFVSRGLKPDKTYKFQVRAEVPSVDGELMTEVQDVVVSAGDSQNVQFAFAEYDKSIETALTLNVPEGAKVTLAGNETRAVGDQRTYRTSQLKPGQIWDDYEVEVEYEGEIKRQNIRLIAGDQLQLSFAFSDQVDHLASR
ncbi:MAG: TIGR03000 domain-containing protein [Aureliella sp.]